MAGILPAIALSGAVSFGYEVLWTRLLGASLEAFATMLASFLLGIALGSALAARLAGTRERAALGFGLAQLGIAVASVGAFDLADGLPVLTGLLGAGPEAPLGSAAVAAATLLPITLCLGATFPFAVRVLAQGPEQAAAATARVFAWNTVGALAGALGTGFLLLPRLEFAGTLLVGVAANLILAAVTALRLRPRRTPLAAAATVAGVLLAFFPPSPPWTLLSSSPLQRKVELGEIVYAAMGRSSTVMLTAGETEFTLKTNGLRESVILREGMQPPDTVARWLGLLPTLLRPDLSEMLVVGLGGGMALEPIPSTVETIDIVELEHEALAIAETLEAAAEPNSRRAAGSLWWPGASLRLTL